MEQFLLFRPSYRVTPIGTRGFVNLGGVIHELKLTSRLVKFCDSPNYPILINVWKSKDKEFLTRFDNRIVFNGKCCHISESIEKAKRNIEGDFNEQEFSIRNYFIRKYGIEKNICDNTTITLFKMVDGMPEKYKATYTIKPACNTFSLAIPDIDNGLAFRTAEECINNYNYGFVPLEEEEDTNDEIVVKAIIKKSDLEVLKRIGFKIECL